MHKRQPNVLSAELRRRPNVPVTAEIINWYYHRIVGLNIPRFWRKIFQLLPSMAIPLLAAVAIALWAPVYGYLGVVLWGAVFVAVYAFFLWFFGMNRYERDLVTTPVRRILRRFGR